jgi:formylglycine-generating enzyme required for sulfatase activity
MGRGPDTIREPGIVGYMSTPEFVATLTQSFWLGTYEATAGRYARCVEAGACPEVEEAFVYHGTTSLEPGYYRRPEHADLPMAGITHAESDALCVFLGGRLPTEADWERAVRGEDDRTRPWGGDEGLSPPCYWANYPLSSECSGTDRVLAPVGSFPVGAGPWGHHDLVGNVSEHVADGEWWYDGEPRTDPRGPDVAERTMVRPGSRPAAWSRSSSLPDHRALFIGTRCAWDSSPSALRNEP